MKTCEDYRVLLIDAAAADSAPSYELRSHLDACVSCSTAFAEEKQLFAAIDTGLHVSANAEVPPSLFPRVRVQLNEEPVPLHWFRIGAVAAAAVVLVAAIVFARGFARGPAQFRRDVNSIAQNVPPIPSQAASPADTPAEMADRTAKIEPLQPVRNVRAIQAEELKVLIPEGQKRAIDVLLASVRQGKARENVLIPEEEEGSLKEPEVVPLVISPIELRPLADVSAESPSEDEKTRR